MIKTLIMTIGLPRGGKTSWARKQGLPMVNPDSIRMALHGMPFVALAEPIVWAIAKIMVRALFLAGHDKVILDATNTTRQRRDEWRSKDWIRRFHPVYTTREECLSRARAENNEALVLVIDGMADLSEELTAQEIDEA